MRALKFYDNELQDLLGFSVIASGDLQGFCGDSGKP